MNTRYTKADLERIVSVQLENLNAIHDLLSIMKVQNELIHNANKKLKEEISDFKTKVYSKPVRR
jgi:N-acetylglutamate synthase-like GNAT family acetyltransferase